MGVVLSDFDRTTTMGDLRPMRFNRGMTFLEILLTTGILAAAVVPILGLFQSGFSVMRKQEEYQAAVSLAQKVMAFARAKATDPRPDRFTLSGVEISVPQSFKRP